MGRVCQAFSLLSVWGTFWEIENETRKSNKRY